MKSSAVREMPDEIRIHPSRIKLGITAVDLLVPELNFVFGEACADHAAVFSVARLDPRRYGDAADERVLLNRAVIEAIHELG